MVTGTAPPPTPLTGKTLITSVVAFKVHPLFYSDTEADTEGAGIESGGTV